MARLLPQASLGIRGLPDQLSALRAGKAYAISSPQLELRVACAADCIATSLARRVRISVLAAADTPLVQALAAHDVDALAPGNRRLRLLQLQAPFHQRLGSLGMPRLVDELDHFGVRARGLLLVIPGDDLLAVCAASMEAARALRRWLRSSQNSLILLCGEPLPPTASLRLDLEGVADILSTDHGPRWITRYWRQDDGQMLSPEYPLQTRASGCGLQIAELVSDIGALTDNMQRAPAVDEERVIAMTEVVRGQQRIPTLWELVPDYTAVSNRAGGAFAATCILGLSAPQEFREAAQTVHALRRTHGPWLKIIVYAPGPGMRLSQERLLIAVGANAVVVSGGFDRLLSLIMTLRGQQYTRSLPTDLGAAYLSGRTSTECGYLPPARFCESVTVNAREVATLGLESVLVTLRLNTGVSPVQALQQLGLTREGDIVTADEDTLYLFLSACWERDADMVLDRVFEVPLAELFETQSRFPTNTAAIAAVQALATRLARRTAPDLSAQLPSNAIGVDSRPKQGYTSPAEAAADTSARSPKAPPRRTLRPAPLSLRSQL